MGLISSLFVHKVVDVAMAATPQDDRRRRSLFDAVAMDPEAPLDPRVMVEDTAYYALCERVVREDPQGASVTLRIGGSMRCDDYGAFGLAWKTAVDLRSSYLRAERYGVVLTSVSRYALVTEDDRHYLELRRDGERRLGMRLSNEQTIAALTQISREVSGPDFCPEAVHFRHSAPSDTKAHQNWFGCPVHFNATRDALQVSEAALAVPNRLGDESVSEFFEAHLQETLGDLIEDSALAQRVRIEVTQSLSDGVPTLSDVASSLDTSGRTLQRRLAEQGHAYQDLVDAARRELSERLLRDTDYALAEIAFLAGFSEQSAFTRAFKRWAGQTPRSFRLKA
ncbi:MAG: AraC family transcriptional regulator ligand-binding domain-containing protein [Pseudomonadota bacterium]